MSGPFSRVMANLVGAIDGTPSMIDEVDDDNTPLGHVSQQTKVGIDEDGFPDRESEQY